MITPKNPNGLDVAALLAVFVYLNLNLQLTSKGASHE